MPAPSIIINRELQCFDSSDPMHPYLSCSQRFCSSSMIIYSDQDSDSGCHSVKDFFCNKILSIRVHAPVILYSLFFTLCNFLCKSISTFES